MIHQKQLRETSLELPLDEELAERISHFQTSQGLERGEALRMALITPCERFLLEWETKQGRAELTSRRARPLVRGEEGYNQRNLSY